MTKPMWLEQYIKDNNADIEGAQFSIGNVVKFTHAELGETIVGKVEAVGISDEEFEYAIEGARFLAREFELELT